MKVCTRCHLELPIDQFVVTNKAAGYRRSHCRKCDAVRVRAYYASNAAYRTKQLAASSARSKANPRSPEYIRRAMLKHKYDLTPEQFAQLLAMQEGKCALCGATEHGRVRGAGHNWLPDSWPVDHDHNTGHVRGLLCHPCNAQLGGYETIIERIGEATLLEYLTRPSPVLDLPALPPSEPAPEYRFVAELPPRYTPIPECSVDGCNTPMHAGGLCFKHYTRQRRNGTPGPAEDLPHAGGTLTADDVRAIRAAPAEWGIGTKLAAQYGVTVSMISKIRKGTARQDVPQENACPT